MLHCKVNRKALQAEVQCVNELLKVLCLQQVFTCFTHLWLLAN